MKRKILSLLLMLCLVLTFASCGTQPASNTEEPQVAEEQAAPAEEPVKEESASGRPSNQILFAGSSTLAPVMQTMAANYFEEYGKWDKVDSSLEAKNIEIYISSGGSGQGVAALIDGTTDFGMVARSVKDTEKEQIKDLKEFKVGIDALTISVNPKNPIAEKMPNLTKEQIVAIFSGEYANWSDLEASLPNEPIVVVTRDLNGGAHEVFQSKIMGDKEVKADSIQAGSMGELVSVIIDNPNAIGYASFGVANQNAGKVIPLSVDGVEPTSENVVNGSYPIQRPLLLITSGELTKQEELFMNEVMGDKGREVIEGFGFIPMN